MTKDEAIDAYEKQFGYVPWGIWGMGEEHVVKVVEEALKTGKEWKQQIPPGAVL